MATQPTGINRQNLGTATRAVGDTNQAQFVADTVAGLQAFTDPGAMLGSELRRRTTAGLKDAEKELRAYNNAKLRTDKKTGEKFYTINGQRVSEADFATRRANLEASVGRFNADLNRADPVAQLRGAFSEQFGMRDSLLGRLSGALNPTSEYNRMQDALGRGVQARTTEAGTLGDQLMSRAMSGVAQGGQLSPEAQRDAVQSARSAFAARGMATGNAAIGAELLNRDRFARQREMENLNFASGVQANDLARRQTNNTIMGDTDRFNLGLLGQSASLADQERSRQIGVGQDQYNFAMATDPRAMMMNLGSPFANLRGATEGGLNVASFNQNVQGANYNTLMNNNAYRDAANASKPQWWETGIGAVKSLLG
jgi:hypothetical protein